MLIVCALAAPAAAGGPDPKRRVAVLEFRSGSAALTGIDARLAALLAKQTSLAIVDGDAARRAYGAGLDRDLVACAGTGSCVARIGKRLAVAEVLLVGVSEFGDVILTLQRVDVGRGRVVNRIAEALEPGAAPDDQAIGRYLKRLMPGSDFIRWGEIRIDANVDGADVLVDNLPRGRTPLPPLRLRAPATYEIQVEKKGYVPFGASVRVPADGSMRVKAVLGRRGEAAWYSRWWVAALAGTVVVGAATTAFIVTRDSPGDVPVVVVLPE
jgi:hypothetical protein